MEDGARHQGDSPLMGLKAPDVRGARRNLLLLRIAHIRRFGRQKTICGPCDLICRYDVVCCEDLNVKGMVRNRHLAKSVSDASWSTFVTMLEYKAKWYGKTLVRIGRFYPSSKTCHHCGHVKEELSLADRYYTCPNCGELIDRDLNAAMNILDEDLRNTSGKIFYCTDGECVRLACKHSDFFVCKCDCYSERLAY